MSPDPTQKKAVIECGACERRCVLESGEKGVCRVRANREGEVGYLWHGQLSACNLSPIEIKPFYHFWPGTRHLSLGGWGCNFRCRGCQNWEIACTGGPAGGGRGVPGGRRGRKLSPAGAVELAREVGADGVSFTYNEPTVWLEYMVECAESARRAGLLTDMVTNGYMTGSALKRISGCMDAVRFDVKGTQECYDAITRDIRSDVVLRNSENARAVGMHVEIVTNLIPGISDGTEVIKTLAGWIAERLGPDTPWHLTRFHPARKLMDLPATSVDAMKRSLEIARSAGLLFAYLGNMPGHRAESTWCPGCGRLLVKRTGWGVTEVHLDGRLCPGCGYEMDLTGTASLTNGGPTGPRGLL